MEGDYTLWSVSTYVVVKTGGWSNAKLISDVLSIAITTVKVCNDTVYLPQYVPLQMQYVLIL